MFSTARPAIFFIGIVMRPRLSTLYSTVLPWQAAACYMTTSSSSVRQNTNDRGVNSIDSECRPLPPRISLLSRVLALLACSGRAPVRFTASCYTPTWSSTRETSTTAWRACGSRPRGGFNPSGLPLQARSRRPSRDRVHPRCVRGCFFIFGRVLRLRAFFCPSLIDISNRVLLSVICFS